MDIHLKSTLKWILRISSFLILFLVLVLVLLRFPAVQTKVANIATNAISKKLDTELSVDKVAINFIDNVCLKGIYAEDLNGDTLLYAEKLNVDLGIFKLLKRIVDIEKVVLENSVINIHQQEDKKFSFQFIVDAFTPENPKPKKEGEPFVIDISTVELLNSDYSFDLLNARNALKFDQLLIKTNKLDLEKLVFDVEKLAISNMTATSSWDESDKAVQEVNEKINKEVVYPFSNFPGLVKCDNLSINGKGIYEIGENHNKEEFDPKYIHANDINIDLNNVIIDSTMAKVDVSQIAANLNDRFSLNKFQTQIEFTPKEIVLSELDIETAESKINLSAQTDYGAFNQLLELEESTNVKLNIKDFQVQPAEVAYFVPQLKEVDILKSYMQEDVLLTADLQGSLNSVDIGKFNLKIAKTDLKLTGRAENFLDVNALTVRNMQLNTSTSIDELRGLLGPKMIKDSYSHFGNIDLSTTLDGDLNSMNIHHMDLSTDGQLALDLSGQVNNILQTETLSYDMVIENMQSGYQDVQVFSDSLPELLAQLDTIHYEGELKGDVNTYDLKGTLLTSLGDIFTDLYVDFNEKFTNVNYKGDISLDDFELGKLLSNDSLGTVTLNASLDGRGMTLDSISTILDATVEHVMFNGYDYRDLEIDGRFIQRNFNGFVNIEDENLVFDFEGLVDFNDSIPRLDFNAALSRFDAKELKLTQYPLQAQLNISSDISGLSAKNICGNLKISDIVLKNEKEQWKTDSIIFSANNLEEEIREIHLNSSFANMDVVGKFEIEHFASSLINFGDQYFPFSTLLSRKDTAKWANDKVSESFSDETMKAKLVLKDLPSLASFFKVDLKELDSVYVALNLDGPSQLLNFELFVPSLQYGSIYADSLYLFAETKNDELKTIFKLDSISAFNTAYIPGLKAAALFKGQKANISTFIDNDTGGYSLAVQSELTKGDNNILLNLRDPFVLNNKEWTVNQSGTFEIGDSKSKLPEIRWSHNQEELSLTQGDDGYTINFNAFDLNNLLELVEVDSALVTGAMNGDLKLYTEEENMAISGDLAIDDIFVNTVGVGDLHLLADKKGSSVTAEVALAGNENDVKIQADYNSENATITGDLGVNKFYLPTIAPFLQAFATDLEGYLSGDIDISGSFSQLDLNGKLAFNEVSGLIKPIGTQYAISEGSIGIKPNKFSPNLRLKDDEGRAAYLTGHIDHDYFSDYSFDLVFKADAFTFLNSERKDDDLFFGKFVAKVNTEITGNLDLPVVRGSLTTLGESDFTIQLLSPKAVANQEKFVILLDGTNYSLDQIDSIANERYKISAGVDLNVTVNVREDATLRLIIDPLTGDNLEINGNAELAVKMPPYGDLDISGVYTVTSGFYRFSFQQFLKRKFELVSGSQINFSGDPMNAGLNLKAAYRTEASAFSLVADEASSLSDQERNEIKKKTDVEVLLQVAGKLREPELGFDIQMPESNNTPVGSSVTRALSRIKLNESELNKQVFSLLLFDSFTGSQTSGNISSTGTSTAMRSVGNLINTQLNRLASKAEVFRIDFNLDQYANQFSETGEQITEIDLGVSQSLLNDRLVISLGTNVGLESGNQENGALSNVAGDFVLSYKLTEDGRYAVRVFQKSDFDALNDSNIWKTGAGFSYQAKFGNLRRNRKKKNEER